jgi:hypothetical protein
LISSGVAPPSREGRGTFILSDMTLLLVGFKRIKGVVAGDTWKAHVHVDSRVSEKRSFMVRFCEVTGRLRRCGLLDEKTLKK